MVVSLGFGVEIELALLPKYEKDGYSNIDWYNSLVRKLCRRGEPANYVPWNRRSENYNEWTITTDSSIRCNESEGWVPVECASPILRAGADWEARIETFWDAIQAKFLVGKNVTAGSHIHVAPYGRSFDGYELVAIAYACCHYENCVVSLLPLSRSTNRYCVRNSDLSEPIKDFIEDGASDDWEYVTYRFGWDIPRPDYTSTASDLIEFMQGNERCALWNFKNLEGKGTIEFRGGRHLRGPNRTKWWATFVITFIHMALSENLGNSSKEAKRNIGPVPKSTSWELDRFWNKILRHAQDLYMDDNLPSNWRTMREPHIKSSGDSSSSSSSDMDSDSDDDFRGSTSRFSGSRYDDDDIDYGTDVDAN